jgi:hypothetical protein
MPSFVVVATAVLLALSYATRDGLGVLFTLRMRP